MRLVNILGVALHVGVLSLKWVLLGYVAVGVHLSALAVLWRRLLNAFSTLLRWVHSVLAIYLHLEVQLIQQLVIILEFRSGHLIGATLVTLLIQTSLSALARASALVGLLFADHDDSRVARDLLSLIVLSGFVR